MRLNKGASLFGLCLNKGVGVLPLGASLGGGGGLGARRGSAPALCSPARFCVLCLAHLVLAARALSLHRVAGAKQACSNGLAVV